MLKLEYAERCSLSKTQIAQFENIDSFLTKIIAVCEKLSFYGYNVHLWVQGTGHVEFIPKEN